MMDLERLAALHDATSVMVAVFDQHDRLQYANPAYRSAWFLDPTESPTWGDFMRRNFHARVGTVIRASDYEEWLRQTLGRRGKVGFKAFETDLHDGRWVWMTETVQSDGWMLCIANDITHLKADERAIRQNLDDAIKASLTDELTGCSSRRYAMARLDDLVAAGHAPEGTCVGCVAVCDLDNFKYVNDRYGHLAGDMVLKDFARIVQGHLRKQDVFGRIGGEEFFLVMPGLGIDEARLHIGRMLKSIHASRPLEDFPDFEYSFSAGVSSVWKGERADRPHGRADEALYLAKLAGRNTIRHYEAPVSQAS
jgi:diguanylate cyclase (GGDEF)-like protein